MLLKPVEKNISVELKSGQSTAGFTLLEVIVASTIVIVGLVGAMTLITKSIGVGDAGANRLVAANLAQEGIEIVKNIRDLSYDTNGWDNWFADLTIPVNYLVQYNDPTLNERAFVLNTFLKYNSATGLYGYDVGGSASIFQRVVSLTKKPAGQIQVVVTVTWNDRGSPKSLVVEDILWNWR